MADTDHHEPEKSGRRLGRAGRTALGIADSSRRWPRRRVLLQSAGLAIGLSLLIWVIALATSDENAASFDALRSAPARLIAGLIGLSLLSLVLNGLLFWLVLVPLARISLLDTIFVNAMATFLSILPFKISLLTRSLIHHRRHGLRFKIIFAWLAALGALAMTVLIPLAVAGLWRQQLDVWWWLTVAVGVLCANTLGVVLGRLSDRAPVLRTLSLGAHAIVRHPTIVAQHAIVRLLDITVLSGRFLIAASLIGLALDLDQAALFATTYFVLSILTPAGTLGPREMGVAALGLAQDQAMVEQLALMALVVSAAEILSAAIVGALGALRIRPDRLLLGRSAPDSPSTHSD